MRTRSVSFVRSFRDHWCWAAVGCIAAGGTGLLLTPGLSIPGFAQGPAIIPDAAPPKGVGAATNAYGDLTGLGDHAATVPTGSRPISARSTPQQQPRVTLEFNDVPVTELLAMIATQGEVSIAIGSDVDPQMRIPFIRSIEVTPEEAIEDAALAAGLQWRKRSDKKYFVGKTIPSNMAEPRPAKASTGSPWPIDFSKREALLVDNQTGRSVPINEKLPSLWGGAEPQESFSAKSLFALDDMAGRRNRNETSEIRPVRVRNVRPGIIAWWLDPKRHEPPYEYAISRANMNDLLSPYRMKSAVDPAVLQQMSGRMPAVPFATPYTPYANPYTNPYANPYGAWAQPQYRSNAQFGGFGGGGGFGGNQGNRFGNQGGGGGGGFGGGGVLELPEGIDQLVAIDAQNVLLVYGTAEGVARLQTIIEYLDRPIRQVEIEAQFIDVSVNEARAFGIQFFNRDSLERAQQDSDDDDDNTNQNQNSVSGIGAGVPGANQLTINYKQYQAQISFLTSNGRARIINSPRVTTMNNLSANLQSTQITPIILTSQTEGIGGQVGEQQNAFFLSTSIGIQVTPTINNDDTITVFLTPFVQTQVPTPSLIQGSQSGDDDDDDDDSGGSSSPNIPTVLAQQLTTVANVKDNDVIVLGGLRTRTESIVRSRIPILSRLPLIGRLFRSTNRTDVDRELIIFLTARILRRTNDVVPIPGP